jgi:hypothetical protein
MTHGRTCAAPTLLDYSHSVRQPFLKFRSAVGGTEEFNGIRSVVVDGTAPVWNIVYEAHQTEPLDLQRVLTCCRPHVLHFSGHSGSAALLFAHVNQNITETTAAYPYYLDVIDTVFRSMDPSVLPVVLVLSCWD